MIEGTIEYFFNNPDHMVVFMYLSEEYFISDILPTVHSYNNGSLIWNHSDKTLRMVDAKGFLKFIPPSLEKIVGIRYNKIVCHPDIQGSVHFWNVLNSQLRSIK
jgi:hypothetical protein